MIEENNPHEDKPSSPRHGSMFMSALAWMRDLTLALIIAGVVILFVYQPVQVEGTSMEPTLVTQERIFINKFTYRFGLEKIGRGDMIVFWSPQDPSKSYIKRVIGLPGELVSIEKGTVYINGYELKEDYVPAKYRDEKSIAPQKVKPNHYFVLGDHRSSSNDSRAWGQVARDEIYGKAVFVYWPPERIGPLE